MVTSGPPSVRSVNSARGPDFATSRPRLTVSCQRFTSEVLIGEVVEYNKLSLVDDGLVGPCESRTHGERKGVHQTGWTRRTCCLR